MCRRRTVNGQRPEPPCELAVRWHAVPIRGYWGGRGLPGRRGGNARRTSCRRFELGGFVEDVHDRLGSGRDCGQPVVVLAPETRGTRDNSRDTPAERSQRLPYRMYRFAPVIPGTELDIQNGLVLRAL